MGIFKCIFLTSVSWFFQLQAQIHVINPNDLYERIARSEKATIVQFWIPNCENVEDILKLYDKLESAHSEKIDFYFIGISDKNELVNDLLLRTNYKHSIYLADRTTDIYSRKEDFALKLCELFKKKQKDFNSMYINRYDKIISYSKNVNIKDKLLKTLN